MDAGERAAAALIKTARDIVIYERFSHLLAGRSAAAALGIAETEIGRRLVVIGLK